jgi:hypothetical protein
MDWKGVGQGILNVAPALAAALGGPPAGMIASGAAQVLSKFLGLPENATPDVAAAAAAMLSPEQYVELQKIDSDYKKQLLDAGVKLEEIAATDRDSARGMQTAAPSLVPAFLTWVVVSAFVSIIAFLIFKDVPTGNKDILVYMVGQLSGIVASACAFWLGTTRQGERKTELIAQAPAVK